MENSQWKPRCGWGRQTREQITAMTEAFQASQPGRQDHSNTETVLA